MNFGLLKHRCWLIILPLLLLSQWLNASCIKGYITDSQTHQPIPDVNIRINNSKQATATDSTGYFEICDLNTSSVTLTITHTAYETLTIAIQLPSKQLLRFPLLSKENLTQEVLIEGKKTAQRELMPGIQTLNQQDILKMPQFMGETDVLKAVQLMPGIQAANEGNSGLYVRGGGAGHNLFLLDKMELMNPSHLMGIYSVFNPLTTHHVDVYKGNAPSQYEGRLASIIDVASQHPVKENNFVAGNIGNLASNLALSQSSKNGKWGIIAGVRRSYLEALSLMSSAVLKDEDNYFKENSYNFYDFNGKIRYAANENSFFYLTWYIGNDHFGINNPSVGYTAQSQWGNGSIALAWDRTSQKGFRFNHLINYTASNSQFDGNIINNQAYFSSRLKQLSFKNQVSKNYGKHQLHTGFDVYGYQITPFDFNYVYLNDTLSEKETFRNGSLSLYIGDTYKINPRNELYAGIRLTDYLGFGPYTTVGDSTPKHYSSGEVTHQYFRLSPTLSFQHQINESSSFKAAYSLNQQYTHLASIGTIPLPNDFWVPSTPQLKPEYSHQLTLGYYNQWRGIHYTVEIYGKQMNNLLLLNLNTDNTQTRHTEEMFYKGKGIAYGIDMSAEGAWKRLNYAFKYSLGHSQRSFDAISNGDWFNDKYDRIHDLNALLSYRLNQRWDFSALWIYATGNTTTLPAGRWWMMGTVMNDYNGYNNFRMPAYHRLDLSVNYHLKSNIFKESVLNFSLINAYNRMNPYFIFYKVYMDENRYNLQIKVNQVSLFPIMPSFSWRFKF